ncbi:MAG: M4 family metallopeptidase, partial [Bacteroidales bacterium]|nr:M4 family metallopeptidase [Bacteroidales bacterium]
MIRDADGTAATRYSGSRGIKTKQSGQIYVLQDITRGNGIETLNLKQACKDSLKNVTNGFLDSNAVDFTDSNNQWTYAEFHNAKKDDGALDAHWGMIKAYDYFKQVHGRNGFDGHNAKIKSYIHYGTNYCNASWMRGRKVFIFGDGTDTVSKDIYTALDIIGHEFGHAICQYSAQLVYKGESGAIEEALSDIWGACVEYWADSNKHTWLIGEDKGSPIRSMSDPKSYSKPNTYKGQYWKDTNFTADHGGVHTNCCVVDYWFYLLSVGGSGTNDFQNDYNVSGIGITKAAKIVYSAEENIGVDIDRSKDINFFKFKHYTIRAAETLYGVGSQEVKSVKDAWYAVGVYSDLFICDTATDYGTMPSNATRTWCSPDIWITNPDSIPVDEIYSGRKYKVWVRIYNRNNNASSGTERLFLNWAKAGFNEYWNDNWTRNHPYPSPCYAIKGDTIGDQNGIPIPSIPANGHRDVGVLWWTPIENYDCCTEFMNEKWHYCILARVHDDDTIAHENEQFVNVHDFIRNHNNVASRNITVKEGSVRKAVIQINNATVTGKGRIICFVPKEVNGSSITDYAEVYITLDAGLLNAINSSNISGLTWVNSNTLRWNGGNASIPVTLPANSYYTMMTTVHFLADQIPATNNFDFDMVLRNANGDSILGGEHYQCIRTDGRYFQATAHDNMTVLWGETATLYADNILETAEYKWYDDQGNEVGSGLTCNVNPLQNTTYTLRVTADADGYRAYSTVTVLVVDGELRMLAPNPADNQVRIGYALSRNVSSATLQILNGSGQVVHSQVLNGGNGSKVTGEVLCNTSSLAAGS